MSISISQVSFEHHREALGIAEAEPRISWRFEGDVVDWEQTSYDIEVARSSGDPSTYTADGSDSLYISWPEAPLGTAESAQVRVRAHGGEGQPSTDWSEPYVVETGLIGGTDDWVGAVPIAADRDTELGKPKAAVHFRNDFSLGSDIDRARLYITALGIYEAEINGERVGENVLAPGWQSYHFRHAYDTYDVTDLVKEGDNAIGVTVGEGWYVGRMGFENGREWWGDTVGVQALLQVYSADGSVVSLPTNTSWSASTGPILTSDIYDGEVYDSRIEADIEGWSSAGFSPETPWLATKELDAIQGTLTAPDAPPIRIQEDIKPQSIFQSPSGKTVIDFGQNLVGWLRLNVEGPAGTNITLHHAEVLEDGELALRPLRSARATDTLLLHGNGPQTWEPHFTFHGFRYAQVDGWPEDIPIDTDGAITARVMHSDLEQTGWFTCSHELLSKFHSNVRWSMRGNFLSVPTDCPQRDERLGWTGDAHAFGPTANFLYATAGFWRGWHRDVWSEMQRENSMRVPFFVPTLPLDSKDQPAAVWGDVAVGNPWNLYRAFGDKEVLREQFPQAQGWIDVGIPRSSDGGLWDRSGAQFGDWLDPLAPPEDAGAATTHKYLVADAYLVEMTRVLANISEVLGDDETAAAYLAQHDKLRSDFQAAWIVDGELVNRTQTAYALALEFGLYTDEAEREKAGETLRSIISENNNLVGTGFAGTPALGPALERIGAQEDFYSMLLQTEVPSWLYQVVQNATTTWERWDSLLPDGSVNPGSMTSFNHYAFGAVADWIHGVVGGMRPAEPGWRVIGVAPVPGGGITSAETRHISGYGEAKVSWSVGDGGGGFTMEVTVPPNTRAKVTVPGGETTVVGSGVHSFSNAKFRHS
jgi:alpha-L-rhamnosidase